MNRQLKQLIEKATEILKTAGATDVYVFGSTIRGTLREDSDIDFAVSGLPPTVFFKAMGQVADIMDRPIDLIDLDDETPFTQYLKEAGELQRVEEIA